MLRYFVIHVFNADEESVTVNCVKTLMLWACEEKHPKFWTAECELKICSVLLQNLRLWFERQTCKHYFIPVWNLFDFKLDENKHKQCIETLTRYCDPEMLMEWFVVYYCNTAMQVQWFYSNILQAGENGCNKLDTIQQIYERHLKCHVTKVVRETNESPGKDQAKTRMRETTENLCNDQDHTGEQDTPAKLCNVQDQVGEHETTGLVKMAEPPCNDQDQTKEQKTAAKVFNKPDQIGEQETTGLIQNQAKEVNKTAEPSCNDQDETEERKTAAKLCNVPDQIGELEAAGLVKDQAAAMSKTTENHCNDQDETREERATGSCKDRGPTGSHAIIESICNIFGIPGPQKLIIDERRSDQGQADLLDSNVRPFNGELKTAIIISS